MDWNRVLKKLTYLPESKTMLGTETVMCFGREETRPAGRELGARLVQRWRLVLQQGTSPRGPPRPRGHSARDLPFLETNWEVTPASNVAKTGLWSLVMMSLVLPAGEGRGGTSEQRKRNSSGQAQEDRPTAEVNASLRKEASGSSTVSPLSFRRPSKATLKSLSESVGHRLLHG